LNFSLVCTCERNKKTDGTALHVYQLHTAHLLAYIEWYTLFGTPNLISGLFTVKPSTCNNHIYGEIIEVNWIVHNCHLLPKFR
ncbi:hypothetical protein B0H10DRAFT_1787266, partial [Mycena sp. CBHHK59/15]